MRLVLGSVLCTTGYAVLLTLGDLDGNRPLLAGATFPLWALFLAVTWWVRRGGSRCSRPVLAVILAAVVLQVPGLLVPPRSSSDAYRYVWDGRVQLSGTSPYRFAPLDDRLASLRDPVLFPGLGVDDRSGYSTGRLPSDRDALLRLAGADPQTRINRPKVTTIYPPVAQAWFTLVAAVTPWSAGTLGLQLGSAAVAVLLAGLLALWRRRRGGDPLDALWWAWCPTVVLEAGNGAHVDILSAALVLAAVALAGSRPGRRRLRWLAGFVLGLAASVKLTPLALAPALAPMRSGGLRAALPAPVAAVVTLALTYLPHVLVAGGLVLGYLPGYLAEEGGANRAGVLGLVLPDGWLGITMVLVMALAALWAVTRRPGEHDPARLALVLFGVLLLTTTPSYPWYALPLVALAVLTHRLEWLAVAVAGYVAYAGTRVPPISAVGYAVALVIVVVISLARAQRLPGRLQRRRVSRGSSTTSSPSSRTM